MPKPRAKKPRAKKPRSTLKGMIRKTVSSRKAYEKMRGSLKPTTARIKHPIRISRPISVRPVLIKGKKIY